MKLSRQGKIREIISERNIETQEEILLALKDAGYSVTQATVSRDIKEMKLVKKMASDGKFVYAMMSTPGQDYDDRVSTVFRKSVLRVDIASFLVVLHTLPAMAQAAALAIDAMNWQEIVGTIAGDDTIFVAVRHQEDTKTVMGRFRKMMKTQGEDD